MAAPLKRQRLGWYIYDWANSAFSATVVTVFLGPFLTSVAKAAADPSGKIHPFGIAMDPGGWFAFMVSLSVICQVLVLPAIGVITDATGRKRTLLGALAFLGALATTCLFFLSTQAGNYMFGGLMFVFANVCFGASIVVYNSFLPQLGQPHERDGISSRGWALGYLGGGLLLLLNLLYFQNAEASGDVGLAVRVILASAGIWWLLFTIPSLAMLPRGAVAATVVRTPVKQLVNTFRHMKGYQQTLLFLVAYLFYNDAVQTVIAMASVYGQEELALPISTLTTAILIVQFVAIGGSLLFERIAHAAGTKRAIVISIIGWIAVLLAAYAVVRRGQAIDFYVLASIIAVVMGGIQSLSRSMFSRMIPSGMEAEYFSLYELSDKGTSWLGPLLFGLALTMTGSYRIAILSLLILFVAGLALLLKVNVARAEREAQRVVA